MWFAFYSHLTIILSTRLRIFISLENLHRNINYFNPQAVCQTIRSNFIPETWNNPSKQTIESQFSLGWKNKLQSLSNLCVQCRYVYSTLRTQDISAPYTVPTVTSSLPRQIYIHKLSKISYDLYIRSLFNAVPQKFSYKYSIFHSSYVYTNRSI